MSDPYELEHWRSRAKKAEAELESARNVIIALRSYEHRKFLGLPTEQASKRLDDARRAHESVYWTVDDALRAAVEFVVGDEDEI
jgi:hypothetical protein